MTTPFRTMMTGCTLLLCVQTLAMAEPQFRNFGPMVEHGGSGRVVYGPAADGELAMTYMLFNNANGSWFMVALDTRDGASTQYVSPGKDQRVTSGCLDAEGRLYAGTVEGNLFRFDPRRPEEGLVNLGPPAKGEGYLFNLTQGPDGRVYMGTYPGGRLLAFDPATGQTQDYGQARETQLYTQEIAVDQRYAYADAGVKGYQIIRFDLKTGKRTRIDTAEAFGDDDGPHNLFLGVDGKVYCYAHRPKRYGVIEGERVVLLDESRDRVAREFGRLAIPNLTLTFDFNRKQLKYIRPLSGETGVWPITYSGVAAGLYSITTTSGGVIYGSSYLPLRMFSFDLKTRGHTDLGVPFPTAAGQVYRIHEYSPTQVYAAAYGDADVVMFDATMPWTTDGGPAEKSGTNPISLGLLGDDQNRPYDIHTGPDGMLYFATTPDYGTIGGALTRLDPKTNTWQVFRNIIQDHTIASISAVPGSDHLIAGGSASLATGHPLGAFGPAELFLWDTQSNRVVYRTTIPFTDAQYIMQMEATVDGLIVGFCGSEYKTTYLFVFDPQKQKFLARRDVSDEIPYGHEGDHFTPEVDGRHLFVSGGKVYSIQVLDRGRDVKLDVIARYPGARKGGVLGTDPGDRDRDALFFLTEIDLVALYLDSLK